MKLLKLVRLIVVLVPIVSGKHMTRERRQTPVINEHFMAIDPQQGQELCARFSKEPYFSVEMLLGKPWRVYYSWNIDLQNKCVDMTFVNATPAGEDTIITLESDHLFYFREGDQLSQDGVAVLLKKELTSSIMQISSVSTRVAYLVLKLTDRYYQKVIQIVNRFYKKMNEDLDTWPFWNTATVLVRMGRKRRETLLFADPGAPGTFQGVPFVNRRSISPGTKVVPLLKFHLKLMYGGKYLLVANCQVGMTTLSTRRNKLPYREEISGIVSKLDIGPGYNACQRD